MGESPYGLKVCSSNSARGQPVRAVLAALLIFESLVIAASASLLGRDEYSGIKSGEIAQQVQRPSLN